MKKRIRTEAELIVSFSDQHLCFSFILYYLNPKFQASSHLLWLYSPVCVGPGRKPEDRFSHDTVHLLPKVTNNKITNNEPVKTHDGKMGSYLLGPKGLPAEEIRCVFDDI